MRVHLIGSQRLWREVLHGSLSQFGIPVTTSELGVHDVDDCDGLSAADVVLVDATPGEPAIRLTRQLKRTRRGAEVVVFGPADTCTVVEFAAAGATGYVSRGQSLPQVVAVLEAVHEKRTVCEPAVAAAVRARLQKLGSRPPGHRIPGGLEALTARERQILDLVAAGRANKQIAAELGLALSTVKNHLHNVVKKLGVRNRWEAARTANGLASG